MENRVAIIRHDVPWTMMRIHGAQRVCVCEYQLQHKNYHQQCQWRHTTTKYQPNAIHFNVCLCVCVSRFPYALSLPLMARTHWQKNHFRSEKSNGKNHIRNEMRLWCSVCMGKTEGYIRASRDTIQDSSSSSRFSLTYIRTLFLFQPFGFFFVFSFFRSPCVVCSSVRWSRIVCAVENVCVFLSL